MVQTISSPFAAPFGVITKRTEARTEIAVVPPTINDATLRQVQARLMWDESLTRVLVEVALVGTVLIGATLVGTVSGATWLSLIVMAGIGVWMFATGFGNDGPGPIGRALAPRLSGDAAAAYGQVVRVSLSHESTAGRELAEALVAVATTPLPDTAEELVRFETAAAVRRLAADPGAAEVAAHQLRHLAGHAQLV
ncbi:hypothetical protein [Georgenia thermotolerans]|uniref:Uncharacterized protein n=1 Tax=Georgenia thermotolerans TaxID=527326 RepID=A0A7J5UPH7_9MICO|nr:hypothetical protein [Georgenia thermotolerans]KAE8764141.1 hypothetical protein GB883_10520 [Georgenia thermotolerans]